MKRFIADSMLGKLCRWLRMLGVDTLYDANASDDDLIDISKREGRIILTCDKKLFDLALKKGVKAFLVKGRNEAEKLANLSKEFNIALRIDTKRSRCPLCNSRIKRVKKEEVKSEVLPTTFKSYRCFWKCMGCGKIFWKGPHWRRIRDILEKASTLIS